MSIALAAHRPRCHMPDGRTYWTRPRSDFMPKRKTAKSYQSLVLRLLIILTITLPVLIRMCLAPPYTATAQALLITITAVVSTLMLGIVFFTVTKHMSTTAHRRRHVFLTRRQSAATIRCASHRTLASERLTTGITGLTVCTGPFNLAASPLRTSSIPESISSESEQASPVSLEVMRVMLPVDDPPSYYDVVLFNSGTLPEVHRNSFGRRRSETPPPSYDQVAGAYL